MRKMVEIEYVGIEDAMQVAELAHEVMLAGHYATFNIFNIDDVVQVDIYVQLGGWSENGKLDFSEHFRLTEDEYDVKQLNKVKHYLNSLLVDEESEALN